MIAGNYMFMRMLKEDGVAAFSVCCYLFPLVFMFANAIAQSQLPIVSYNFGLKDTARIKSAFKFSVVLTTICGVAMTLFGIYGSSPLISMFLNPGTNAFDIASKGFPLFAISFVIFSLNIVIIGFWQSIEHAKAAIGFMLLRGLVFLVPIFIALPGILGIPGLWLAVPLSEFLTFIVIAVAVVRKRREICLG